MKRRLRAKPGFPEVAKHPLCCVLCPLLVCFPCVRLDTLGLERKSRNPFISFLYFEIETQMSAKASWGGGDVPYSSLNSERRHWNIRLLPPFPTSLSSLSQTWGKLPLRWSLSLCPQLRYYILMTVASLSDTLLNAFPAFAHWLFNSAA